MAKSRRDMTQEERRDWIAELRRRYQQGTLRELLVPEDADYDRLLREVRPRWLPRPS